eukprot:762698-Prymnesium_polylepis.1
MCPVGNALASARVPGGRVAARGGLVLCSARNELQFCVPLLRPPGLGLHPGVLVPAIRCSAGRPMCLRLVEAVVPAPVLAELAEPVPFVELLIFAVKRASRPAAGIPAF